MSKEVVNPQTRKTIEHPAENAEHTKMSMRNLKFHIGRGKVKGTEAEAFQRTALLQTTSNLPIFILAGAICGKPLPNRSLKEKQSK